MTTKVVSPWRGELDSTSCDKLLTTRVYLLCIIIFINQSLTIRDNDTKYINKLWKNKQFSNVNKTVNIINKVTVVRVMVLNATFINISVIS